MIMSSGAASAQTPPDNGPLALVSATVSSWLAAVNANLLTTCRSGRPFFIERKPDDGIQREISVGQGKRA
jgi:hypothetical protein